MEIQIFLEFFQQQSICAINDDSLNDFSNSFLVSHLANFEEKIQGIIFPLSFTTAALEFNFLALINLLTVGAHYESSAYKANQPSLRDVILFGVLSKYLGSSALDASMMIDTSSSDVSESFSIPRLERNLNAEKSSSLLSNIVTIESRGPMADYADLLTLTLVNSGRALKRKGYADLNSLLLEILQSHDNIEDIIRALSEVILPFDDRHFVTVFDPNGEENMVELCFNKNARRLFHDLSYYFQRLNNSTDNHETKTDGILKVNNNNNHGSKLRSSLAAPSARGISALFHNNILIKKQLSNPNENTSVLENDLSITASKENTTNTSSSTTTSTNESLAASIKELSSGSIGTIVSVRTAAVIACHRIADTIVSKILNSSNNNNNQSSDSLLGISDENKKIIELLTPLNISIYLDYICDESLPLFTPSVELSERW